jgi:hypothetical protein
MSTPSGKPFNPFDLSAYTAKGGRERPAAERRPVEKDSEDILRYAPKKVREQTETEPQAVEKTSEELLRFPVAPKPVHEEGGTGLHAVGGNGDEYLRRLASSSQREGAGQRLPRAVQLPPVHGLSQVAGTASPEKVPRAGETFINGFRVPPSLEPERLRTPPPMRQRRDNLRGPIRILIASTIAAPLAYYFSVGGWTTTSDPAQGSKLSSLDSRSAAPPAMPLPQQEPRPNNAQANNAQESLPSGRPSQGETSSQRAIAAAPVTPLQSEPPQQSAPAPQSAAPPQNAAPSQKAASSRNVPSSPSAASSRTAPSGETLAMAPASTSTAPALPAGKPIRELDPEEVKLLMKQGEQFVAAGDLVTARLVFQRAAEAGDATAALAMGATYDPIVLAKLGVRGYGGDVEKARNWYEKAKEFGSPEAPRRLELLANR